MQGALPSYQRHPTKLTEAPHQAIKHKAAYGICRVVCFKPHDGEVLELRVDKLLVLEVAEDVPEGDRGGHRAVACGRGLVQRNRTGPGLALILCLKAFSEFDRAANSTVLFPTFSEEP